MKTSTALLIKKTSSFDQIPDNFWIVIAKIKKIVKRQKMRVCKNYNDIKRKNPSYLGSIYRVAKQESPSTPWKLQAITLNAL